jgi:hypothetical protein
MLPLGMVPYRGGALPNDSKLWLKSNVALQMGSICSIANISASSIIIVANTPHYYSVVSTIEASNMPACRVMEWKGRTNFQIFVRNHVTEVVGFRK